MRREIIETLLGTTPKPAVWTSPAGTVTLTVDEFERILAETRRYTLRELEEKQPGSKMPVNSSRQSGECGLQ